jgi:hypothetical protein
VSDARAAPDAAASNAGEDASTVLDAASLDAGEDTSAMSADATRGAAPSDAAAQDARADADDASRASPSPCDAGPPGPPGNQVGNWSFECGLSPWYAWQGSIKTTTAIAHSGTTSVVVSNREQVFVGPVQDLTAYIVLGQTYQASAYVTVGSPPDGGAPTPQSLSMTARYLCAGAVASTYTYTQIGTVTGVLPGSWTEVSGSFATTCTALYPGTGLEIYVDGAAVGLDLYVDDVVVR